MNMYKGSAVFYIDKYDENDIVHSVETTEYFVIAAESYPKAAQTIVDYYGSDLASMFLMEFNDEPMAFLKEEVWNTVEEDLY